MASPARRLSIGATALIVALLVPPLFILTVWLTRSELSNSLLACTPNAAWIGGIATFLWLSALAAAITLIVLAYVKRSGRPQAVGALAFLIAMAPVLLIVTFVMTFGDPIPGLTYRCPF